MADIRADALFDSNLTLLEVHQPRLAERLRSAPASAEIGLAVSKTGLPILIKKGQSLHSRHDPLAEARSFTASAPFQSAVKSGRIPFIYGLGLGYHVQSAARIVPELIVFEPDLAVIRAALSHLDWTALPPNIRFLTHGDDWQPYVGVAALIVHRPSERVEPGPCGRLRAAWNIDLSADAHDKTNESKRILVVGPVCGGSLPVARHTARALKSLGHEVAEADMSSLDPYYQTLRFSSASTEQKDAVGRRMIAFAGEYAAFLADTFRPHLLLALAQAPLDIHTLARIRRQGVPTAFWFVEDHRYLTYYRELAAGYDYFFHIQGAELETELLRLGAGRAQRLPLAADPDLFRPVRDEETLSKYRADLSFMGAGYPNRREVFRDLLDYDLKIWGTEWDLSSAVGQRVRDQGRRIPTEETVLIYNAARININLHSSVFTQALDPSGGFVNPRAFEISACGAFQLVDSRPGLDAFFTPGREIVTFDSLSGLRRMADYYLARPELRREIGEQARARILREHTYRHRMAELLACVAW